MSLDSVNVGETLKKGGGSLTDLVAKMTIDPDPAKARSGNDDGLLHLDYPKDDKGLSVAEATNALFAALAALPPEEQHRKFANLYNATVKAVLDPAGLAR